MMVPPKSSHRRRRFRWWAGRILLGGSALFLVLAVVIWAAGTSAKSRLAKQYPAPGQLVDVGGYRMHVNCIGQGSPTVVLEAGQGDFSVFWGLVQSQVATFARVCTYDRAGYGWSEPSPYPRTSGNMVRELHALLVNAQIAAPYVLVGHSLGGAIVRLYANDYPDEVVGMVLVDSVHEEQLARIPALHKAVGQLLGLFRTLAPLGSFGALALAPAESLPDPGLPAEALAQYRAIMVTTGYFETAIAEVEAYEENLTALRVGSMVPLGSMPLVVLSRGRWDPIPGLSEAENQQAWQTWQAMQSELVALSTNAKQITAERSGHNIHLQQPELVIDAIRQVMESAQK